MYNAPSIKELMKFEWTCGKGPASAYVSFVHVFMQIFNNTKAMIIVFKFFMGFKI